MRDKQWSNAIIANMSPRYHFNSLLRWQNDNFSFFVHNSMLKSCEKQIVKSWNKYRKMYNACIQMLV